VEYLYTNIDPSELEGVTGIVEVITGPVHNTELGIHMRALQLLLSALNEVIACDGGQEVITLPFIDKLKYTPAALWINKFNEKIGSTPSLQDWKLRMLP
jgi:hypothetical protein